MKTSLVLFTLFFSVQFLLPSNTYPQWQPEVRLTNDPASSITSENNAWCIAASGNDVHVVWYDDRDGNDEIYYRQSTDGGSSWEADTRLTDNSAYSYIPTVSVSDQIVHLVWVDTRDGNDEIYYKRSTDGGSSWEADTRLSNNFAASYYPSISASGLVVLVVWEDNREGNNEIYCKSSADGGINWGAETRLTSNSAASNNPSVAVSSSFMHVVWQDNRDANREIYYKCSTDGGVSWGTDIQLTNNFADSRYPSVSLSDSCVHVVWHDNRDGNDEIYYKRSTDGGLNWGPETRLTNDSASSFDLSISASGQVVNVVWTDTRDGNDEIYYKQDPTGSPTGMKILDDMVATEYSLFQNFPNPFNPSTTIRFELPKESFVSLKVYNILGEEAATLLSDKRAVGRYEVSFDGSGLTSGVYFFRLQAGEYTKINKALLLK